MNRLHRFLLLIALLLAGLIGPHAMAQDKTLAGFSETEKAGFAFYHLVHQTPPFDDWIKKRADYKAASPRVQLEIIDQERVRLNEGFLSYFPTQDLITLKVPVTVSGSPNPDFATNADMQMAGLTHAVKLDFTDLRAIPYIGMEIGKLWIGIIPNDIESITTHYVTEQQYKNIFNTEDLKEAAKQRMTAQLVLRPQSADATEPMMAGDLPVWLMLADIGTVMIANPESAVIWQYAAPWYEGEQASSLMTLFAK